MPITNTLDISRRLAQAGVPASQAEVLSEVLEGTAQDAVREMRALVTQEGERIRTELRSEFRATIAELRSELLTALGDLKANLQRDLRAQMLWFFTLQTALLGVAIAVIRFWK